MDTQENTILYELSGKANSIMKESFNICAPLYKGELNISNDVQFSFIQLFSSCYLSSESVYIDCFCGIQLYRFVGIQII